MTDAPVPTTETPTPKSPTDPTKVLKHVRPGPTRSPLLPVSPWGNRS